ncbi:MAG: hypothetical protein SFU98_07405, partial [Leptospiraceae bacterium]|nr:hypothetical protein [Leptospiraceae bacterium]
AERKLDKKIRDDFFVQPLLQGAFVTGLARTASSTTAGNDLLNTYTQFQTFNANSKLIRTLDSRNDLNREEDIANKMLQFAAGVYVVQLIHSAIVGYYWAKKVPKKFSDFETEKKSGWNLQLIPLPRINSTNLTQGMEMRLGYSFEF